MENLNNIILGKAGHNIGRETAGNISATIQGLNQKLQALAIATSLALSPMACSKSENKDTAGKDENPTEQTDSDKKVNEVAESETPASSEPSSTGGLEAKETKGRDVIAAKQILDMCGQTAGGTLGSQLGMYINCGKRLQQSVNYTNKEIEDATMIVHHALLKNYNDFSRDEKVQIVAGLATFVEKEAGWKDKIKYTTSRFMTHKDTKEKYLMIDYIDKFGNAKVLYLNLKTGNYGELKDSLSNFKNL